MAAARRPGYRLAAPCAAGKRRCWCSCWPASPSCPLAGLLGLATEKLAARVGEGIGGFLNATLGNAAELIIALVALRAGMLDVVKASLTGSIIGNLLLVLGAAFLAGGLKHPSRPSPPSAPAPRSA